MRSLSRWGADHATADELASRTLTLAWMKLDQVPPEFDEAERWLHGVAKKCLANHRRVARREAERHQRYMFDRGLNSGYEPNDLPLLLESWEKLDQEDRDLLWLVGAEGFGPEELADQLHCSKAAAKSRVWRARRTLGADLGV